MKFKKTFSLLTGVAALIGVSFIPNVSASPIPNMNKGIEKVSELNPVFLELGNYNIAEDGTMVSAHYSHSSHGSHGSHGSHYSHYSSRY